MNFADLKMKNVTDGKFSSQDKGEKKAVLHPQALLDKEKAKSNRFEQLISPSFVQAQPLPLKTTEQATVVLIPKGNFQNQIIRFPKQLHAMFNPVFYLSIFPPRTFNPDPLPVYACSRLILAQMLFSTDGTPNDLNHTPFSLRSLPFHKGIVFNIPFFEVSEN